MTNRPEIAHRVCVVDDDAAVRRSVKRLLKAANYTVETFASAAEFLAGGAGITCGCAILDVLMPGMDGLSLQRELTSIGVRTPVIFFTARDEAPIRDQALKNGAAGFLSKSASGKELLDAVCAAFSGGVENRGAR